MTGLFRSARAAAVYAIGLGQMPLDAAPEPTPGHGKAEKAQWDAGKVAPSFHHISRQVKRREQRKAMKRMGVKA